MCTTLVSYGVDRDRVCAVASLPCVVMVVVWSVFYGQVVVYWQYAGSVLQAGSGGPAGYSIGRWWYEYSVFYRLAVVCLCCVLQAGGCGPAVCSMGRQ